MSCPDHGNGSRCSQSYYKCQYGCETPVHLSSLHREYSYSSRGRRSPVLGHELQCYYWDNKCHCDSRKPYRLPPEAPPSDTLSTQQVYDRHLSTSKTDTQHYYNYMHGAATSLFPPHPSTGSHHTPPPSSGHERPSQDNSGCSGERASSSRGRRSPVFGHEPQCYSWDNKCHCDSTKPYQLPPEDFGQPAFSDMSSLKHEWPREGNGGRPHVPPPTPLSAHRQDSDPPPSYESLFGLGHARSGDRQSHH